MIVEFKIPCNNCKVVNFFKTSISPKETGIICGNCGIWLRNPQETIYTSKNDLEKLEL